MVCPQVLYFVLSLSRSQEKKLPAGGLKEPKQHKGMTLSKTKTFLCLLLSILHPQKELLMAKNKCLWIRLKLDHSYKKVCNAITEYNPQVDSQALIDLLDLKITRFWSGIFSSGAKGFWIKQCLISARTSHYVISLDKMLTVSLIFTTSRYKQDTDPSMGILWHGCFISNSSGIQKYF